MKKFMICEKAIECKPAEVETIKAVDVITAVDVDYDIIKSCDTLTEAREAFKNLKSDIYKMGGSNPYYLVTVYYITEVELSEDGEEVETGNIWDSTEL